MSRLSVEDVTGWEYETEPDSWTAMTVAGIPTAKIDGINRCRYTVQAVDALTTNESYVINGEMGEIRDWG
jgi:hypothetical protein